MRLEKLETFVVANPPPRHGGRYFIFLRLITACGITGVGEIYNATFGPNLCTAMAHDVFERQFAGRDPHHIERLWRQTYGAGFTMRPDVTVMGVLSGLEMACWDIIGKAADQPVYQLLGGKVHDRLRSYTYLYPAEGDVYPDPDEPNVYNDADIAAEAAVRAVEQGFTAVKFDPAGPSQFMTAISHGSAIWTCPRLSADRSVALWAIRPIFCLVPTASSQRRVPNGWHDGSRPMTRFGLKSPFRRKTRPIWQKLPVTLPSRLPQVKGFAPSMSLPACSKLAQPQFYR